MHPRNRYREKHDFPALIEFTPELREYLTITPGGETSLDFSDNRALFLLNRTLLLRDYGLRHWDLPKGHLVPPIPGRLDYIHTLADLTGSPETVLDIGTGASLIYPILGVVEYGWSFIGTETNDKSVKVAQAIAAMNATLKKRVTVRQQPNPGNIFENVINPEEYFGATMCNPPFYENRFAAEAAGKKKWKKLGRKEAGLSFGGADSELWTAGGEQRFLLKMVKESFQYRQQVGWFTTLVSKKGYLKSATAELERVGAGEIRVIAMEQGNKKSRMLAWHYR